MVRENQRVTGKAGRTELSLFSYETDIKWEYFIKIQQ